MIRSRIALSATVLLATLFALAPLAPEIPAASAGGGKGEPHDHPTVPTPYTTIAAPGHIWTDAKALARGREIYATRCALCHGERGDGKGPGAAGLALKPADLSDAKMVAEMSAEFWFWRVSEGGLVEPFRSRGSAMPAWKGDLSVADRWAVIAYAHTLSGHRGPHDAREHRELAPKPKFASGEGRVVSLVPQRQQIVVEHGEIRGFMEAMTMGYRVASAALLNGVKPGDRVRFTIDTEGRVITRIEPVQN